MSATVKRPRRHPRLKLTKRQQQRAKRGACIGCGCTEDFACDGGCWWISMAPPVCSNCPHVLRP